jgi:hypothetical protein
MSHLDFSALSRVLRPHARGQALILGPNLSDRLLPGQLGLMRIALRASTADAAAVDPRSYHNSEGPRRSRD